MTLRGRYDRKTVLYLAVSTALLLAPAIIPGSFVAMGHSEAYLKTPPLIDVIRAEFGSLTILAIAVLGLTNFRSWWLRKKMDGKTAHTRDVNLQEMLDKVAEKAEVDKIEAIVIDSSFPNAFAFKKGRKDFVAVTIALLEILNSDELESVLAHEVAHIKNKDWKIKIFGMIISLKSIPLPIVPLLVRAIYRRREYLADETSATLEGTPLPLISTLLKVSEYVKSFSGSIDLHSLSTSFSFVSPPSRGLQKLLSSNPTVEDRVKNLMKLLPAS